MISDGQNRFSAVGAGRRGHLFVKSFVRQKLRHARGLRGDVAHRLQKSVDADGHQLRHAADARGDGRQRRRPCLRAPPGRTIPFRSASAARACSRKQALRHDPACRGTSHAAPCPDRCASRSRPDRDPARRRPCTDARAFACALPPGSGCNPSTRFTGRKFEMCIRRFSLFGRSVRLGLYRSQFTKLWITRISLTTPKRLIGFAAQILADAGDAVGFLDGEFRDREVGAVHAHQRDVGAVQRGDEGQTPMRGASSAAPAARQWNAEWRNARAADRDRRSRPRPPCARPAPGSRADIETAGNWKPRPRDNECAGVRGQGGWDSRK